MGTISLVTTPWSWYGALLALVTSPAAGTGATPHHQVPAGRRVLPARRPGICAYATICEHCPNFRTDTGYLPVLAAQRADTETLARDAEARG